MSTTGLDLGSRVRGRERLTYPPDPDSFFREILDKLPAAVYATDTGGRITYFNKAAVELWGYSPVLRQSEWCGSWRLYWPNGTPMAHDDCPMAITIKNRRPVRGMEAIAERPDGTRVPFIPFPTPLFDENGEFVGAINLLVDMTDRRRNEEYRHWLAAIVESSDDAIIGKTLKGIITSWNRGAEKLFGYTAEEAIGQPITILIPDDRHDEEPEILARICRGERIEHYETIRRRNDGTHVNISITISPVKDAAGTIIGASNISRDISERTRAAEQQAILLGEMKHRVKNLAAVVEALGRQSRPRNEPAVAAFLDAFINRVRALLSVGEIVLESSVRRADLRRVVDLALTPFRTSATSPRISVNGPSFSLSEQTASNLALALHELATNALKYGALKSGAGKIAVTWSVTPRGTGQCVTLSWKEHVPEGVAKPGPDGFGSRVIRAAVSSEFCGETSLVYNADGLHCRLSFEAGSS
jgi:PAS domain S-box-containing protein